jgi:hypothetical protein
MKSASMFRWSASCFNQLVLDGHQLRHRAERDGHCGGHVDIDRHQRLGGDRRDCRTDIALTGAGWVNIPVAFSNGDGSFTVANGEG